MPSGKSHNKINFIFLPAFLIILLSIGFSSYRYALCFAIGFVIGTLFLDPDLDTAGSSYRRWGIFKFIWIPYRKLFAHRSIFTHGVIIGDIIRLIYLSIWIMILFYIPGLFVEYVVVPICKHYYLAGNWEYIWITFTVTLLLNFAYKKITGKSTRIVLCLITLFVVFWQTTSRATIVSIANQLWNQSPYEFIFFLIGVVLSSTIHVLLDVFYSSIKKIF